ncbi:MAG: hypothetical protein ACHQQQ_00225 [Bacteroidota bacterium]
MEKIDVNFVFMKRFFSIPALIVIIFFQQGCINPFAPKLDLTPASEACADLTSIENVLCTFRNAYTFKDTTLYGSIIANNFSFSYRDYDRGVDVTWGRNDEMRTSYALFQFAQSLTLIWNNEISSSGNDTSYSSIRGFNLTVTFSPNDITQIDGYANLTFYRATKNDGWKIIQWRDESNF